MSLARGKYGIEYNPHPVDEESSGAGWIVVVVALAALVLVTIAVVRRIASQPDEPPTTPTPARATADPRAPTQGSGGPGAPRDAGGLGAATSATNAPPARPPAPPPPPIPPAAVRNRPQAAQNLLLKLERAEAAHDVELAVSTIEQLRSRPGEAVADLDDSLARRLGDLNIERLFTGRNRQWVKEVAVRRGDFASRIASENGSTLASLLKLNDLKSADRLAIGQKLYVMDHPKFTLVVHRAMKVADLSLKGKFFRRYDLVAPVRAGAGNYETGTSLRAFLSEKGISFAPAARSEIETLLPSRTPVLVSDL